MRVTQELIYLTLSFLCSKKKLTKITFKNSNKLLPRTKYIYVYKTIVLRNRLRPTELSACEEESEESKLGNISFLNA